MMKKDYDKLKLHIYEYKWVNLSAEKFLLQMKIKYLLYSFIVHVICE